MSLSDLEIQKEYRSLTKNVAKEFYIPLLSEACEYKRAVGFFSSTSLIEISYGISSLISNNGKIKLIASPKLSIDDVEAIERGYELREKVIGDALLRELYNVEDYYEEKRLNLLAHLISDNKLDIKIATLVGDQNIGMYHEKMGIITDDLNNKIAFSGSMNESMAAIKLNYEAIDVFTSWTSDRDRVCAKEEAFDSLWNNKDNAVEVRKFPEVEKEIIRKFMTANYDEDIDRMQFNISKNKKKPLEKIPWIQKPNYINFYDYQERAIDEWENNNFRGIYDMATGTGKTLTALGSLERLSKLKNEHLYVIIICPYQHLVEQWLEDMDQFGLRPLVCYSNYNWKRKFKASVIDYSLGLIKNYCVITTNATFSTSYFQELIKDLKDNVCIVVDEAHNFGAEKQRDCMLDIYDFRLGLSATLERHHDELGTKRLYQFFGKRCIEYTLQMAIREGKLTPYYYHPVPIVLDGDEYDNYMELTRKIVKMYGSISDDNDVPKSIEMLLIQRSRIIAGARAKLDALKEIIEKKYLNDNKILVYCGATNVTYSNYKEGVVEENEKRQIEIVLQLLGNKLDMKVTKFTSEENSKQRELIKERFTKGEMLQAIIAIRCLDEGVNIPSIKTVFILASSTNPKEYIQRRGRVLRKAPGKDFATIYDFVTLPKDINLKNNSGEDQYEISLIRREFQRVEEFASLAENPSESNRLLKKINDYYHIY